VSLSGDEQALFDHARASLPHWFFDDGRANEDLAAAAKIMGRALIQVRHWLQDMVLIGAAVGPAAGEPDWLAAHARDRNTRRQKDEGDPALRYRLQRIPYSITRQNLLAAVADVLAADGVAGAPALLELPRDGIYLGKLVASTGVGGTFSTPASGLQTFTPTSRLTWPPYAPPAAVSDPFTALSGRVRSHRIVVSGASSGANNGTFAIVGLVGDALQYANSGGVGGADAGAHFTLGRLDAGAHVLDGFGHSYLGRGERLCRAAGGGTIVVIVPYGTPDATLRSVTELLRQRKAAGVILRVERRENP
jgi:hypothetical protein